MTANRRLLARLQKIYGRKCLCCQETSSDVIDHVIPMSRGGVDCFCNLQPLCGYCNSVKGGRAIDFRPTSLRVHDNDTDLEILLFQVAKITGKTPNYLIREVLIKELNKLTPSHANKEKTDAEILASTHST